MRTPREELARRIRIARDAVNLTQSELAEALGIPRTAVVEIEAGRRNVSGLELERIAYLSGRALQDFLREEFTEDEALRVLFRSNASASEPGIPSQLRDCIQIARERLRLEHLLGIERLRRIGASYDVEPPNARWDAIMQADRVASEERRRLGLGSIPIADIEHLIESQGVQAALVRFSDSVSGAALIDGPYPPLVAVNSDHHSNRRRFSFAHEYAHILFDHDSHGRVSWTSESNDLREVRANAFAAAFLMPEDGVRAAVQELGKGSPSRISATVFDGNDDGADETLVAESRTEPGSQDIQPFDLIQLADRFGVSPLAMIFRLRNLRLISEPELDSLRSVDEQRRLLELELLMKRRATLHDGAAERVSDELPNRRFIGLALEVFRREKISRAKLMELLRMVGLTPPEIERLVANALADEAPTASDHA